MFEEEADPNRPAEPGAHPPQAADGTRGAETNRPASGARTVSPSAAHQSWQVNEEATDFLGLDAEVVEAAPSADEVGDDWLSQISEADGLVPEAPRAGSEAPVSWLLRLDPNAATEDDGEEDAEPRASGLDARWTERPSAARRAGGLVLKALGVLVLVGVGVVGSQLWLTSQQELTPTPPPVPAPAPTVAEAPAPGPGDAGWVEITLPEGGEDGSEVVSSQPPATGSPSNETPGAGEPAGVATPTPVPTRGEPVAVGECPDPATVREPGAPAWESAATPQETAVGPAGHLAWLASRVEDEPGAWRAAGFGLPFAWASGLARPLPPVPQPEPEPQAPEGGLLAVAATPPEPVATVEPLTSPEPAEPAEPVRVGAQPDQPRSTLAERGAPSADGTAEARATWSDIVYLGAPGGDAGAEDRPSGPEAAPGSVNPGGLRYASESELAGIWEGQAVPLAALGRATRVLTPRVGGVRVVLRNKEVFEGRLYAMGERRLWLETALGRMGLPADALRRIDHIDIPDGSPRPGEAGSQDLAGLPQVRVRVPGGLFYGKLLTRDETSVTLVTQAGGRVTLESTDVEAVPQGKTMLVGRVGEEE